MRASLEEVGAIYFARPVTGGLTKIGFSTAVRDRIISLNVGSPVAIVLDAALPATRGAEKALHSIIAKHRVKGEWYDEEFASNVYYTLDDALAEVGPSNWDMVSLETFDAAIDAAYLDAEHVMAERDELLTPSPATMEGD